MHTIFFEVIVWIWRWMFWAEVVFWWSAALEEKYRGTKTIIDDFTERPKQRWCKIIIAINNRYFWHFCMHIFHKNVIQHIFHPFVYSSLCDHFDQSKHNYVHSTAWQTHFNAVHWCTIPCMFRENSLMPGPKTS